MAQVSGEVCTHSAARLDEHGDAGQIKPKVLAASSRCKSHFIEAPLSSLDDLVDSIEDILYESESKLGDSQRDRISDALRRYDSSSSDWLKFCFFEPKKKYTRNLVSTDDERYTLMVLCWNPQSVSPVHDHPCEGCFVRVLDGAIQETMYEWPEACRAKAGTCSEASAAAVGSRCPVAPQSAAQAACRAVPAAGAASPTGAATGGGSDAPKPCPCPLQVVGRSIARAGEVTYIDDGMGLHAVEAVADAPSLRVMEAAGAPALQPGAGEAGEAAAAGGGGGGRGGGGRGSGDPEPAAAADGLQESAHGPATSPVKGYAVTLHLYVPPFKRCRAWTRPEDSTHVLAPVMTYFSEFGELVET